MTANKIKRQIHNPCLKNGSMIIRARHEVYRGVCMYCGKKIKEIKEEHKR